MNKSHAAVLVIDDEPHIRRFIRAGFELEGFSVSEAENASVGLKSATTDRPDLIILDLGLPDMHGSEVLARVRASTNVPIIVLSVESDEHQKVDLLRLGADDYVVKPCGIAELLARADATLRRCSRPAIKKSVVRAGRLSVDLATGLVALDGTRVRLTRKEYTLLRVLALNAGLPVGHKQLLQEIWGVGQTRNTQYLRVLVRQLRRKIEPDPARPRILTTESGTGYRLECSPDNDETCGGD
jgi:two-component system, OmpR family, KDP operon response regulator KdpE